MSSGIYYHKVHKGISQSSQSIGLNRVIFVRFVYPLCHLVYHLAGRRYIARKT